MQVQSTGQTQQLSQMQQTQVRKMDGSGSGQGLQNGSNCTTSQATAASPQSTTALASNNSFSTYA